MFTKAHSDRGCCGQPLSSYYAIRCNKRGIYSSFGELSFLIYLLAIQEVAGELSHILKALYNKDFNQLGVGSSYTCHDMVLITKNYHQTTRLRSQV